MPMGQNSGGEDLREGLPEGGSTFEVHKGEIKAYVILRVGNTHVDSLVFHHA